MSSDEEGELCRFGTPLDPIEEDEIPSKKPITLADQIAVDSNGRRRFHGAFTGGFSAGYWNTVGSRDGWTPREFKSSRSEKATHSVQKIDDFMDEEDTGEFGIAPQRIQTTEDFRSSDNVKQKKRKLPSAQDGPIPGVPVLHLVLESCRDKAAVRLLKRMQGKHEETSSSVNKPKEPEPEPAQEPEPSSESGENANEKIYKCDMGPMRRNDGEPDDDGDVDDVVFEDDEFDALVNLFKDDRFGLNYVGLEKGDFFTTVGAEAPVQQKHFTLFPTFSMVDQHNKKVSIKGQAFGVGAFEEDDDDIYARDDMSKYDFQMADKSSKATKQKAITAGIDYIAGFKEATQRNAAQRKKLFKVDVPGIFEPRNWLKRKSRFGPEVAATSTEKIVGRHDLTAAQRGEILNEKSTKTQEGRMPTEEDIDLLLKTAGSRVLNFTNETKEATSSAADSEAKPSVSGQNVQKSLTQNLGKSFVVPDSVPQIFDRFVSRDDGKSEGVEEKTEIAKPEVMTTNVVEKKPVQKVVRSRTPWQPSQLLCYKMNMEASVGAKPEKGKSFSLFQCLTAGGDASRKNSLEFTNTGAFLQDNENEEAKKSQSERAALQPKKVQSTDAPKIAHQSSSTESIDSKKIVPTNPFKRVDKSKKTELELKIIDAQDKHPSQKKDIFKAIFASDSDDDGKDTDNENDADDSKVSSIKPDNVAELKKPSSLFSDHPLLPDDAFLPKSAKEINILRNTSPPSGIFKGLMAKPRYTASTSAAKARNDATPKDSESLDPSVYGPVLPPQKPPASQSATVALPPTKASSSNVASVSGANGSEYKVYYEEQWTEKKSKKKKKDDKKDDRKDRHKHKSKKSKKEKHKSKKR